MIIIPEAPYMISCSHWGIYFSWEQEENWWELFRYKIPDWAKL